MAGFLSAHGYDPGPTQRPLLSGALAGLLATAPAIALLAAFGSLAVPSGFPSGTPGRWREKMRGSSGESI